MRISSTVALSIGFLVLLITGVLMYSTPYDYLTSSLHVWSAVLVLVCIGVHFNNNWKAYKTHIKKRLGKKILAVSLTGLAVISLGLMLEKAPFTSLMSVGEQLRKSASLEEGQFTSIDLTGGQKGNTISLFAKAGEHYESDQQSLLGGLLTYTTVPQMAVWMETLEGEYIKTLYITGKLSNSSFFNPDMDGTEVRRPEALPHWMFMRDVKAKDGLLVPDIGSTEFDGLTAATPVGSHELHLSGEDIQNYKIKVEVNRSYDFNEYYSRDRFPDDPVYSGSGSSGQPSLIYEAHINSNKKGEYLLALVGHGHHSGQTGEVYGDLSNITTAKNLFDFFVVKIQ